MEGGEDAGEVGCLDVPYVNADSARCGVVHLSYFTICAWSVYFDCVSYTLFFVLL